MGRVIAVANQKGGCGKTTTAINLCACLSSRERRVLLIDMDPQGHAGLGLGVNPEHLERTTYEVLTPRDEIRLPVSKARFSVSTNLDLLPSNVLLSALEQELAGREGREDRLKEALAQVALEYDYMVLDCPPSLGLLTFNALRAAQEVLIPIEPSHFCHHGVQRLFDVISLLRERFGQTLRPYGLITNFDGRSAFSRMTAQQLRAGFPAEFLDTFIHSSSKVREAVSCGLPVIEYDRHCRSAKEFQALADQLIGQESQLTTVALHQAVPTQALAPVAEKGKVFLRLRAPQARKISVAGTFNNWCPDDFSLQGPDPDGYWSASLTLPPGSYRYKFVVDDTWITDPENPLKEEDGFGGINSVIEI